MPIECSLDSVIGHGIPVPDFVGVIILVGLVIFAFVVLWILAKPPCKM
jgi:flagellar biosynthesis/type III secretory pathway M-ring protein FliF/YscJ